MKIVYVAPGPFGKLHGEPFSALASVRLRCLAIAPYLVRAGHQVRLVPYDRLGTEVREAGLFEGDVYVFLKSFQDQSAAIELLRSRGKIVVVDVTENIHELPRLAGHYPDMLARADLVTVSSPLLAQAICRAQGVEPVFVADCVELPRGEVAPLAPADTVELVWFGRSVNVNPLLRSLADLVEVSGIERCRLSIVTDFDDRLRGLIAEAAGDLRVELIEWSPDALAAVLARAHVALLPGDDGAVHVVKSANRLQDAIWSGCLAIGHPLDSYRPFEAFSLLRRDLAAGLTEFLADPNGMLERVAAGQELIERSLTAEALAANWARVLAEALARGPDRPVPAPAMRLNLGCGEKLLAGYVNVDVAGERDGVAPDVMCDLRDLSAFESGSVDEVLAIHVIEHFWRWEVVELLGEWMRVLKPGGRLILECPNLIAACEALLADPEAAADAGPGGQHAMWPLYGDPAWRDPLMTHRWGYTPASLAAVMREAGLEAVAQRPAQFKLGDPRDLRVEGRKPS